LKRVIFVVIVLLGISGFIILGFGYEKQISNNLPNTTITDINKTTNQAVIASIKPDIIPYMVSTTSDTRVVPHAMEKLEDTSKAELPLIIHKFSNSTVSSATVEAPKSSENRSTENKFTVIKSSEKSFEVYIEQDDNTMQLITFNKKDWGTWNIGNWYSSKQKSFDINDYEQVAGGAGTDWEYVFRVGKDAANAYNFSGGNHGKEILNDIRFNFGNDEKELNELKIGERMHEDSLTINESTSLTLDDGLKNKYANVTRIYTILPSKIMLDTHFEFTSDVYMETSYVCMFPIPKNRGKFIKFDDSGNVFETPALGETLTTGDFENFIGKEGTLSVQIWGETIPSYEFNVKIDNEDMVDNFDNKLKVFYWDLNQYSNKLYFSKFDSEDPKRIFTGTKWDNKAEWEFVVKK
jgi:hypothetical protein